MYKVFHQEDFDQDSKEYKLLRILNEVFKIKRITYSHFNSKIQFSKDECRKLYEIEDKDMELVIFDDKEGNCGISSMAIISTISKIALGKTLALRVNTETDLIEGWSFVDYEINDIL